MVTSDFGQVTLTSLPVSASATTNIYAKASRDLLEGAVAGHSVTRSGGPSDLTCLVVGVGGLVSFCFPTTRTGGPWTRSKCCSNCYMNVLTLVQVAHKW